MASEIERFAARYHRCLRRFIDEPEAAPRDGAYQLGLSARADGLGVVEVAAAHTAALQELLRERKPSPVAAALVRRAGDFLVQCLWPFDESSRAWRRLNQTLEKEAKRVAGALHDEQAQLLASAHFALAGLAADLPPRLQGRTDDVRALLHRIESDLRRLSHELRPPVLDRLGLKPALQFLAENVARRTRIRIAVDGKDPGRLPSDVEITLYRIVQEALNNVARHARASRVSVQLHAAHDRVSCTVRDDGIGFAADQVSADGLGLLMMRERLSALDGTLKLSSTPRRGTMLCAEIPRGAA
jgi:signal transduction histidine kinase